MRRTSDLIEIADALSHVADVVRVAAATTPLRPVAVEVVIEPDWIGALGRTGEDAIDVVDQLAAVLTGRTPDWISSNGGSGTYSAELTGDGPWKLRVSTYARRPSEADLLRAENERLRAMINEAAVTPTTSRAGTIETPEVPAVATTRPGNQTPLGGGEVGDAGGVPTSPTGASEWQLVDDMLTRLSGLDVDWVRTGRIVAALGGGWSIARAKARLEALHSGGHVDMSTDRTVTGQPGTCWRPRLRTEG